MELLRSFFTNALNQASVPVTIPRRKVHECLMCFSVSMET